MLRFSIIIPNYNKGKYVYDCLNSISKQTISSDKYEVLFVDDGSSDDSLKIASKFDVKILHSNRLLAGGARNVGIKEAKGEYLLFLDSDDFLASNTILEELDEHINGEDIIFLNSYRETENGTILIEEKVESLAYQVENIKTLACPTKCFKKDIIALFDENCYYEDVYFTLYAICNSKSFSYFKNPYYTYRFVEGSITKCKEISSKKMIDVYMQISKLYYLCEQFPMYKINIINRIKRDRLKDRLDVLNTYFETGRNTFYEKF